VKFDVCGAEKITATVKCYNGNSIRRWTKPRCGPADNAQEFHSLIRIVW